VVVPALSAHQEGQHVAPRWRLLVAIAVAADWPLHWLLVSAMSAADAVGVAVVVVVARSLAFAE
jgi:hypothetical protein